MATFQFVDGKVVAVLTPREQAKVAALVTAPAPAQEERTYATKAQRAAGQGFTCPACARNDLRVAPHPATEKSAASVHHKDYNGSGIDCRPFGA
jgi:hypothetical protein